MQLTEYNTNIPSWLYANISKRCVVCGAHLADDGPLDDKTGVMKLTQRFCINPRCPGYIAKRIDIMAKDFHIKGFGPKTALSLAKSYGFENHLQILPIWFPDSKPKVHLWEVGSYAMIYGYSGSWKEMVLGMKNFTEYFTKTFAIPDIIYRNKEYLLYCETFFDVKAPMSTNVINVMLTGSINNFSNRSDFVEAINLTFGKYVQVVDIGRRARDVSYLIKEEHTIDHSKSKLAESNGIPIVTPLQFLTKIAQEVTYKIEEERSHSKCE